MADLISMLQAAAGAGAGGDKLYIEDVFSTTLYAGNNSTQTITNNLDLSGEGGMVWSRVRSAANWALMDTVRGGTKVLTASDGTAAEFTQANAITAFSSTGYSIGAFDRINSSNNACSWAFRKAPKFFDIVTYTGNGTNRTISHNLGSTPGFIFVKRLDSTSNYLVYHRSLTSAAYRMRMNGNFAEFLEATAWNSTAPTSTVFSVGTSSDTNANNGSYIAYLFAHDAGGFGDAGTENVITCGSYVGNGAAGNAVTLGYEPQWLMVKARSTTSNWTVFDNMRALSQSIGARLYVNLSDAEDTANIGPLVTPTGFISSSSTGDYNVNGVTYIYVAIRRGPMKKPTAGTDIYYSELVAQANTQETTNVPWPPDIYYQYSRNGTARSAYTGMFFDRLRGLSWAGNTSVSGTGNPELKSYSSAAESTASAYGVFKADSKNITMGTGWGSASYGNYIHSFWRRCLNVLDVVCYSGTGANRTVSHGLGVIPELMIIKRRGSVNDWAVYAGDNTDYLVLNTTAATADDNTYWNDTSPTSTVFSVGTNNAVNASGSTYVAYLFASLDGVSKIGTYTGNGSSVTVTTGFQPRFILVKRTDSTGNWITGNSYLGFVAGNDPFWLFNSDAIEVTDQDWIDVSGTGFTVNETAANANVNTGTYIYLVIS